MKDRHVRTMAMVTLLISGMSVSSVSAQDKNSVKVPGGLSFAEFKGYENWEFISLSQGEHAVAAILGNPEMINAYKQGYPGNGKPFPDGAKMAKVHWIPAKSATAPAPTTIPGTLHDADFMVKDSKRFKDSGGWGYAAFNYDPKSGTPCPPRRPTCRRSRTTPSAVSGVTRS